MNNSVKHNAWQITTLNKVIELIIDHRGKTPKKLGGDWSAKGYRAISAKTVKKGRLVNEDQMNILPLSLYKKWMKDEIRYGDIFLTSEAPLGEHLIWTSEEKLVLSQRIFGIRTKTEILDPFYFNYFIDSAFFQHELKSRESGSTVTGIKQSELLKTKIILPPHSEQKAIAAVLTSFDDKIELLRQQNQTLEDLAQTLFKEWFVDFRFPGFGKMVDSELGMIPEGWRVKGFLDLFNLLSGGTPKTSIEEYWNGEIKWISAKDVTPNHRKFILETEKSITQLGLEKSATKLLPEYTVVISARGTVGNYSILAEPMCISQSNYGVRAKDSKLDFYTYLVVGNQIETLKSQAYGSVFDTITTSTFKGLQIISPPKDILYLFEEVVNPLFKKILNNSIQIQTLTQLRDRLLPKMMSGEVRVII